MDARTGSVMLHFSQLTDARSRFIYNAYSSSALPGYQVRAEGGQATGDADADNAYDYLGDTYDYFWQQHGRDSWNGGGAPLIATVHYCPSAQSCPYQNAFWNGSQMVFGDGFSAADDVTAHELTHAVTETSANLFYYMQSGALNESYSDIFGETVDLWNGRGTDTPAVRWLMGEDVPGFGAIRNMMNPNQFGDPGRVGDRLPRVRHARRRRGRRALQQRRPEPRLRAHDGRRDLQRLRDRPHQGRQDRVPRPHAVPAVGLGLPRQLQRPQDSRAPTSSAPPASPPPTAPRSARPSTRWRWTTPGPARRPRRRRRTSARSGRRRRPSSSTTSRPGAETGRSPPEGQLVPLLPRQPLGTFATSGTTMAWGYDPSTVTDSRLFMVTGIPIPQGRADAVQPLLRVRQLLQQVQLRWRRHRVQPRRGVLGRPWRPDHTGRALRRHDGQRVPEPAGRAVGVRLRQLGLHRVPVQPLLPRRPERPLPLPDRSRQPPPTTAGSSTTCGSTSA